MNVKKNSRENFRSILHMKEDTVFFCYMVRREPKMVMSIFTNENVSVVDI